jgi:F-type H+-transporting ATPase subunit b
MPFQLSKLPLYFLETGHHDPLPLWEYLLQSNVFNVLLVVLFLGWVFKKVNLPQTFERQRENILLDLETAEQQHKRALAELETLKTKTANLSQEVDGILKTARESAEAVSAQIIENAKQEANKIVETSRRRVELEQKAAAKSLEARLMNDALQQVRETLTQEMDQKSQDRSVEAFLEELSQAKAVS